MTMSRNLLKHRVTCGSMDRLDRETVGWMRIFDWTRVGRAGICSNGLSITDQVGANSSEVGAE
jgi:hypothetical protein